MRFVGSIQASAAVHFSAEDARPAKGIPQALLLDAVGARYEFQMKPQGGNARTLGLPLPSLVGTGMAVLPGAIHLQQVSSFRVGRLAKDEASLLVQQMDINLASDPGAIVVQASDTDVADAVLSDLLEFLEESFGFRGMTALKRQYVSNVSFILGAGVESKIKEILAIQDIINEAIFGVYGENVYFDKITFSPDPALISAMKAQVVQSFNIERRANHPYSENRFFSSAPLKTGVHCAVLEKIAAIIEK